MIHLDHPCYIPFLARSALLLSTLPGYGQVPLFSNRQQVQCTLEPFWLDCPTAESLHHLDLRLNRTGISSTGVKCRPRLRNFYQKLMLAAEALLFCGSFCLGQIRPMERKLKDAARRAIAINSLSFCRHPQSPRRRRSL